MEKITREVRIKGVKKEVVVCVHSMVGKKYFLIQFEDGKKQEISSYSLVFLSPKEAVEIDEAISH